jgi:predicted dehydrogenase
LAELGIAVVGAGFFAHEHLRAWARHPETRLLAVVDRDAARAEAAAEAFGGRALPFDDALALGPDLVDLAVPPEAHLPLIERCMAAGRPTICQKPFCGGLTGARRAVAMAEGTPLIVHENFRFQPWWRRIHAEIRAGRVGEPYQVTMRLRPGDGQGPGAYLDRQPYFREMPRLLVHETAVHLIDVMRLLLGEPDWVWADLRRLNPAIAGEDAGLIVLGFPGGARGLLDGNRLADHAAEDPRRVMGEALVEGSAGTLALDGDGGLSFRAHGSREAASIPLRTGEGFGGGCVAALQAHVVDHLLRGATLENEARSYLGVLEIVEAVYASAREGRRVDLGGMAA